MARISKAARKKLDSLWKTLGPVVLLDEIGGYLLEVHEDLYKVNRRDSEIAATAADKVFVAMEVLERFGE